MARDKKVLPFSSKIIIFVYKFYSIQLMLKAMSAIEQKIISLFSPLPFSIKAKIVAALSQLLANETVKVDHDFLPADLETSNQVREMISKGDMKLLTEEEYWSKLQSP